MFSLQKQSNIKARVQSSEQVRELERREEDNNITFSPVLVGKGDGSAKNG